MPYFLVTVHFKMEDGTKIDRSGWYSGDDYIDACEAARLDRKWDLRPHMREGEFTHPEQVVSASISAKRYNVREIQDDKRVTDFDHAVAICEELGIQPELPGATREDIAGLEEAAHPYRVPASEQRDGFGGIA